MAEPQPVVASAEGAALRRVGLDVAGALPLEAAALLRAEVWAGAEVLLRGAVPVGEALHREVPGAQAALPSAEL